MSTHHLPAVEATVGRSLRPPRRETTPLVTTASASTASAPATVRTRPWHVFTRFRFEAADVRLTASEIEADLGYGRD